MSFTALQQAIINARLANPGNYQNVASNYLQGSNVSPTLPFLQSVANTGTFNIQTSSGFYNVQNQGGSLIAVPTRLNSANPSGLNPTSTQTVTNNANNVTDALNTGIHTAESYLIAHPVGLIVLGGLALLLLFRK